MPGAGRIAAAAGIARAAGPASFARHAMPAMRSVHPLRVRQPEECVFVLPHGLIHHVRAPVASYRAWLASQDATADYQYLRQHLQLLQYGQPPRRWVLKSPFHLLNLDALLAVFPDATIVWTHRDPVTALASWCSLVEIVRLVHLPQVDRAEIGRDWAAIWSAAAGHALAVRARSDPARFLDVSYPALVQAPAATAAAVLGALGSPAGPQFTGAAGAAQRSSEPGRSRGPGREHRHVYGPDRFGLDPAAIRAQFSAYLAAVPAPAGPAPAGPAPAGPAPAGPAPAGPAPAGPGGAD